MMSGWRIVAFCAVPAAAALFFLKNVADALALSSQQLRSLEEWMAAEQRRRLREADKRGGATSTD